MQDRNGELQEEVRWHEANRLASWDSGQASAKPSSKPTRRPKNSSQEPATQQPARSDNAAANNPLEHRQPSTAAGSLFRSNQARSNCASPAPSSSQGIFPDDEPSPPKAGPNGLNDACTSSQQLHAPVATEVDNHQHGVDHAGRSGPEHSMPGVMPSEGPEHAYNNVPLGRHAWNPLNGAGNLERSSAAHRFVRSEGGPRAFDGGTAALGASPPSLSQYEQQQRVVGGSGEMQLPVWIETDHRGTDQMHSSAIPSASGIGMQPVLAAAATSTGLGASAALSGAWQVPGASSQTGRMPAAHNQSLRSSHSSLHAPASEHPYLVETSTARHAAFTGSQFQSMPHHLEAVCNLTGSEQFPGNTDAYSQANSQARFEQGLSMATGMSQAWGGHEVLSTSLQQGPSMNAWPVLPGLPVYDAAEAAQPQQASRHIDSHGAARQYPVVAPQVLDPFTPNPAHGGESSRGLAGTWPILPTCQPQALIEEDRQGALQPLLARDNASMDKGPADTRSVFSAQGNAAVAGPDAAHDAVLDKPTAHPWALPAAEQAGSHPGAAGGMALGKSMAGNDQQHVGSTASQLSGTTFTACAETLQPAGRTNQQPWTMTSHDRPLQENMVSAALISQAFYYIAVVPFSIMEMFWSWASMYHSKGSRALAGRFCSWPVARRAKLVQLLSVD